jgi:hypothetical protein
MDIGDYKLLSNKDYMAVLRRAWEAGDSGGSISFEDFIESEAKRLDDIKHTSKTSTMRTIHSTMKLCSEDYKEIIKNEILFLKNI